MKMIGHTEFPVIICMECFQQVGLVGQPAEVQGGKARLAGTCRCGERTFEFPVYYLPLKEVEGVDTDRC